MANLFDVSVTTLKKVFDLPGSWDDQDYLNLARRLELEEIDDLTGTDLLEMVLMAVQDLEPRDAADAVLTYKLPESTKPGVRQNIVQDLLQGERPWEQAADIWLHAPIFKATVLLHRAFPKHFSKPDILCLTMQVKALAEEAKELLSNPPEAAFVARMLADAMDESSILERLFDEQLMSNSFDTAKGIIWQADFSQQNPGEHTSALLTVYSSDHWLNAMEGISEFQSNAYNDKPDEEEGN